MYLIDTNVISELRKRKSANPNVIAFFAETKQQQTPMFLSAVTVGELRRGVDLILYRGDQAVAQVWGKLRVPHPENPLDKQIAATALVHKLIIVTRNEKDFMGTGVEVFNPFLNSQGVSYDSTEIAFS
jgi:predicted nucleic acid-binding protein